MLIDPEIYQQETVIVQDSRLLDDDSRRTLVRGRSASCRSCTARLPGAANYCVMCGDDARAERDSLSGRILDEVYRVEDKLAEGGFGAIYRATYLPSGLAVALKVLHAELSRDPRIVARFRRERRNLARLRDPHTVATYDHGETADGTHYIVMELLHGQSLDERLALGPLQWRNALAIMRAVCSSLAEAHAQGIIHRDLKPENIHIGEHDVVKVLDFGLATLRQGSHDDYELTRAGHTVGTLRYMAPEQAVGSECDGRSDIYALGLVGYEMLTGHHPFALTSTATAEIAQAPRPASKLRAANQIPHDVDALLRRCLEREPSDRFTDVLELAAEVERILAIPVARGSKRRLPRARAFEMDPPRMIVDETQSTFVWRARGSNLNVPPTTHAVPPPSFRSRWAQWLIRCLVGGIAVGAAVASFV